jgi:hypothetical protein
MTQLFYPCATGQQLEIHVAAMTPIAQVNNFSHFLIPSASSRIQTIDLTIMIQLIFHTATIQQLDSL